MSVRKFMYHCTYCGTMWKNNIMNAQDGAAINSDSICPVCGTVVLAEEIMDEDDIIKECLENK